MDEYIGLTKSQHAQLADKMARLACAAYYRAKLEPLYFGETESRLLEARLKDLVDAEWTHWLDSAKAFMSMAYVITADTQPAQSTLAALIARAKEPDTNVEFDPTCLASDEQVDYGYNRAWREVRRLLGLESEGA